MKFLFFTIVFGLVGAFANESLKMPYEKGVESGQNFLQPIRKEIEDKEEQMIQKEGALRGANGELMQSYETISNEIHSGHGVKP